MKSKRGWIATNRLKTNHLFGSIFPRDEKIVDTITDHMKVNGYDQSQPIVVWDRTEEENNRHALYIVDGHTRKCAAVEAGISPVYVAKVKFSSEKEALQYAIHNQRDRRNLTEADLTRFVLLVDSRKPRGGDRKSEAAKSKTSSEVIDRGKSSAQTTAEVVGTTKSKVEKIRTISDHADDQTKQAVGNGSKSINMAYTETQQQRKEVIPMHLRCDECNQEAKKVDKAGQPFKHGLCSKCRKEKNKTDKWRKDEEERERQEFEAEPIDTEAEESWLGLFDYIQNYRESFKFGKLSPETYEKILALFWMLRNEQMELDRYNRGYPRVINASLV